MTRKGRARLRVLIDRVREEHPSLDALEAIRAGRVRVAGVPKTNPRSLVPDAAAISVRERAEGEMRGERKLASALEQFEVNVAGRTALDLGAAAGGFTRVLLRQGAARVYAVDAGFGQLIGSLRQHTAVINLERTNLAALTVELVPEEIGVVTADLSYISLTDALPQLNGRLRIAPNAVLVALVKPQFELGLADTPRDRAVLEQAIARASAGAESAGWRPVDVMD
jgi:23S rRNA (cytidine1920-2'-O)/16S rRNA (cytidine1409-2'-O)-methyltransferase